MGSIFVAMDMQQLYYYIMKILLSGPLCTKKSGRPSSIYIGSEGNSFNLYPVAAKKLDSMETTSMSFIALSLPGFNHWSCAL